MSTATIRTNCVEVVRAETGVIVRVSRPRSPPLGLIVHHRERDRQVQQLLTAAGGVPNEDFTACAFESLSDASLLAAQLQRRLDNLARKSIGHKAVERLLGISPKERRRWHQDGRLPASSRVRWTYAPTTIQHLIEQPDTIARWRSDDGGQTTPT